MLAGVAPIRRVAPAVVPGRGRLLLAALPDWERHETWAAPLAAYGRAFTPADGTTLVLPTADEEHSIALVEQELEALGANAGGFPDVAVASFGAVASEAIELAADAVISAGGIVPRRARRVFPPDPSVLRQLLEAA